MVNAPHRHKLRGLRSVPDDLWEAFAEVSPDGDRSAALRTYMRHATGAAHDELLRVSPTPDELLGPGPLLRTPLPEEPMTKAETALVRGLHAEITGLWPPPSWTAEAVLDSLETLGQLRVPPRHYLGLSIEPFRGGHLLYGVWPEPA